MACLDLECTTPYRAVATMDSTPEATFFMHGRHPRGMWRWSLRFDWVWTAACEAQVRL